MLFRSGNGPGFVEIEPPVPTENGGGKVEVVELFWYGCPHCYHFEPSLKQWLDSPAARQVDFRRVPAVVNPRWALHARAFYAARQLGVGDRIHGPLFRAIHEQDRKLDTPAALADFFAEQGVDRQEFLNALRSFAVDVQTRQATQLTRQYQLSGVPTLIVDGRFRTSGKLAGSYEAMLDTVDRLVADTLEERKTPAKEEEQ